MDGLINAREVLLQYATDVGGIEEHEGWALEKALAALPSQAELLRLLAIAVADADGWCDESRGTPSPDLGECRQALRRWGS
jgi:tellurite resistance protein